VNPVRNVVASMSPNPWQNVEEVVGVEGVVRLCLELLGSALVLVVLVELWMLSCTMVLLEEVGVRKEQRDAESVLSGRRYGSLAVLHHASSLPVVLAVLCLSVVRGK